MSELRFAVGDGVIVLRPGEFDGTVCRVRRIPEGEGEFDYEVRLIYTNKTVLVHEAELLPGTAAGRAEYEARKALS